MRADINYAVCEKICIPVQASAELSFTSVASTEDSALFAALDTVPKPANVGDPNPLTIRDVKRDGKSTRAGRRGDAGRQGRQPVRRRADAGLGTCRSQNCVEHSPPGVKRFAFELDGVPPGTDPEGAALKLTLVGGDHSYEFNINLD